MQCINALLRKHQEMFHWAQNLENGPLCGDVMDIENDHRLVDEEDFYGCDFSGDRQVAMLFHPGCSNYFPGVWLDGPDSTCADTAPVYIFDIPGDDGSPNESVGNVRQYVDDIIDAVLAVQTCPANIRASALELRQEMAQHLSNDVQDKGPYMLAPIDGHFDEVRWMDGRTE